MVRTVSLTLAGAVLAALGLVGCGPDDVTQARLQDALAETFGRLYVRQQALLGRAGLAPDAVAAQASCIKPGSGAPRGAGEWTCTVQWFGADGSQQTGEYDVQAKAGSCFTATGQPVSVGAPELHAPDGHTFVNPVYGIDGCFPSR